MSSNKYREYIIQYLSVSLRCIAGFCAAKSNVLFLLVQSVVLMTMMLFRGFIDCKKLKSPLSCR